MKNLTDEHHQQTSNTPENQPFPPEKGTKTKHQGVPGDESLYESVIVIHLPVLSLKSQRCCCFSRQVPTELISQFKNNHYRKNGSQVREIIK